MFFNESRTLSINKPFPSVTIFRVTNEPLYTRWRQTYFFFTLLMRFILTITAACLVELKFLPRQVGKYGLFTPILLYPALDQLSTFTRCLSSQGAIGLVLFMMSLSMFGLCNYKEETLVVIAQSGMGISIADRGWWGRGEDSRRCIMLPQMEDMLIHEGYVGSKVRLAIAVRGEDELLVVFPTLLPDRKILELVGRETMKLLRRPDSSLIASNDEDNDDYGTHRPAPSGWVWARRV